MKKEEASRVSIEKSKIVIDTIIAILTDSVKINGKMEFGMAKKGNENLCTLDIAVPEKDYYRHWFMGITTDHISIFYKQILRDILDNFIGLEKISMSDFYTIKYGNGKNFSGIIMKNSIGSQLSLNFMANCKDFDDLATFFKEEKQNKEVIDEINKL